MRALVAGGFGPRITGGQAYGQMAEQTMSTQSLVVAVFERMVSLVSGDYTPAAFTKVSEMLERLDSGLDRRLDIAEYLEKVYALARIKAITAAHDETKAAEARIAIQGLLDLWRRAMARTN